MKHTHAIGQCETQPGDDPRETRRFPPVHHCTPTQSRAGLSTGDPQVAKEQTVPEDLMVQ